MRRTVTIAAILTGALLAAPAIAGSDPLIYPYDAGANYCPSGLQPVTISGVICCGTPTAGQSYQQAKAHPVVRRAAPKPRRSYVPRVYCPEGAKGCY